MSLLGGIRVVTPIPPLDQSTSKPDVRQALEAVFWPREVAAADWRLVSLAISRSCDTDIGKYPRVVAESLIPVDISRESRDGGLPRGLHLHADESAGPAYSFGQVADGSDQSFLSGLRVVRSDETETGTGPTERLSVVANNPASVSAVGGLALFTLSRRPLLVVSRVVLFCHVLGRSRMRVLNGSGWKKILRNRFQIRVQELADNCQFERYS